jgi:hypothetical protein
MFAKLKHVAIVSDRFTLLGKFYQTIFGMKSSTSATTEPRGAATVGDPSLALRRARKAPEGDARQRLFTNCPHGVYHLADPDGVLIDVTDKPEGNPGNI